MHLGALARAFLFRGSKKLLVGDTLRRTAAAYPKKTGVIFKDRKFSWHELNARANSLANAFLRLGLKKRDRVAMLSHNCSEYLEFLYAGARAGVVVVPTNIRLLGRQLTEMIRHSKPRGFIVHQDFAETLRGLDIPDPAGGEPLIIGIGDSHPFNYDFEELIRENPAEEPVTGLDEGDLWMLAYTSGTTGKPKGVMISHKNAVMGAISMAHGIDLRPSDTYLLSGPFYFNSGGAFRTSATWVGSTIVIMTFKAESVLRTIERERVTCFHGGPTMLGMLVHHPNVHKYELGSVRAISATGSALPTTLWKKAEEIFGPVINVIYGMTENTGAGTILRREDVAVDDAAVSERRMSAAGRPMVNVDVRVVDETGNPVRPNGMEVGEIILRGDPVTKGYWNDPAETGQTIRDGWFYTGDAATVDEDGCIYVVDRKGDMIKSGGMRIYPREIEDVIYTHPAVLHCAVIRVPDEKWGETPKALIVLKGGETPAEEEFVRLCRQNLASYKKPTSIEFVDSLPMTDRGKILKRQLMDRYWKNYGKRIH